MVTPKHRKLEIQVLEVLWNSGASSAREVRERLPEGDRPTYETVRSIITRLQSKKVVRRVRQVSKTQIFEAVASREATRDSLIDDFADLFAGEMQAVFRRLVQTGRLTADDLHAAEMLAAGQAA
jgi:predicted transcriptional regulator